ncbi:TolC family protein [Butyricimonas hominis]|uniref:TolC family protein n=1 Tax=Butyricimonas TaxID=574697 RepID=UPI0027BA4300|nr:TolC family protein [Odoribacter splanchnicus]
MKTRILTGWLLVSVFTVQAQTMELSIEECRTLAIENNKELRIASEKEQAAYHRRKAAFTNYLPKISAAGAYMRTSDELSLLSDEQKNALGNLGTNVGGQLQGILQQYPSLGEQLGPIAGSLVGGLDAAGAGLVDALRTDTRNMTVASVMLTQPIYMGGKIVAYNKITRFAEQIAQSQHDQQLQEVILEVDRTYWQIVSLQSKKQLAESYLELVRKLDGDVDHLIEEGMATKADGLSIKVKVNEAEVTLIQVNNGLALSKMLLCQLCGLEMTTEVRLRDEATELPAGTTAADIETALENRPELRSLDMAQQIGKHKVTIARSEFMPNVALTGGYLTTNPSLTNGFQKKFNGLWNVGVVVKIPILTWGERHHKVQAARREAAIATYQFDEAAEKVELQVTQSRQKMQEATERYAAATRSQAEADENLRCATLGMQEGVIPVSNVLEAQTAWLSAHSEQLTARIDVMLADLYLRKALGTLK